MSASLISADYVRSRGVAVSQALAEWLGRVHYVALSRPTDAERHRYQTWALSVVEDAVSRGIIATKAWSAQSPIMPNDFHERPLTFLAPPTRSHQGFSPQQQAFHPYFPQAQPVMHAVNYRSRLMEECVLRCPVELQPFLPAAFAALDEQLAARGLDAQGYSHITMLQVMQVAEESRKSFAAASQRRPYLPPTAAHLQPSAPTPPPPTAPPSYASVAPPKPTVVKRAREEDVLMLSPQQLQPQYTGKMVSFASETASLFSNLCSSTTATQASSSGRRFVGTSTALERAYSRDEPTPADIRPLPVLKRAFEHVKRRAEALGDNGPRFLAEQLKGLRQDLRVQNIQNHFSSVVYEAAARACLAIGDLGDFNQCQAALKGLHRKFGSTSNCELSGLNSEEEFLWYRIAYLAFCGQSETLAAELMSVSTKEAGALSPLCSSILTEDGALVSHFVLSAPAPELPLLVGIFLQKQRAAWLGNALGGIRGNIPTPLLFHAVALLPPQLLLCRALESSSGKACLSMSALDTFLNSTPNLFLDGSLDASVKAFRELMDVLKIEIPTAVDIKRELLDEIFYSELCESLRAKHTAAKKSKKKVETTLPPRNIPFMWNSADLVAAVQKYAEFLRTRRDATGISEE